MAKPVWLSPPGLLATITENISTIVELDITGSLPITWSLLNGQLPQGLTLTQNGEIIGTPTSVISTTSSSFVIRVSNSEGITDRGFFIITEGPDNPEFITPSVLNVGPNQENFVYNYQYVETSITATSDIGNLSYNLVSGNLPKNLDFREDGLVFGYVREYFDSTSTFTFTVSATNSISYTTSTFSITVKPYNFDSLLPIQIIGDGNLGEFKGNASHIIELPVYDPKFGLGQTVYTLTSGSIPEKLSLNTSTGVISGFLPSQLDSRNTSTFTIDITKTYNLESTSTSKQFSITTLGTIVKPPLWEKIGDLGTLYSREICNLAVKAIPNNVDIKKYKLQSGELPTNFVLLSDGTISGIVNVNTSEGSETIIKSFIVDAYDNNDKIVSSAEFNITTIQTTSTDYTKIYTKPLLSLEKRSDLYSFLNNKDIFIPDWIYRPLDKNFGVKNDLEIVIDYGIEKKHLTVYHTLLNETFYKRRFQFGTIGSAVAKISNNDIYEVVYINILNSDGDESKVNLNLRSKNNSEPELSYEDNSDYVDLINPDDYTNGIREIRSVLRSTLDSTNLADPLFMNTIQPGDYTELGFFPHIILCYTNVGKSKYIIKNIAKSGINFKDFDLQIDRLYIDETNQN